MDKLLEKYKGIHPGLVLERELNKRHLKKGPFAMSVKEYPQIINDITKGRRGIAASLSLRIDNYLGLEEGTMYLLQAYYDIKKASATQISRPDVSKFRSVLFWDTDIEKIDWHRQKNAIIKRVFERGNEQEINEALRFYGANTVQGVIGEEALIKNRLPLLKNISIK